MRAITRFVLSFAFLSTASADQQVDWQCFGSCMPGCQQSNGFVTQDTTVTEVLAPNECENFCKQVCTPLPEQRFDPEDFLTIIDETEIDSFSIESDDEPVGAIECENMNWCKCNGAAICSDFIARCIGKGNILICTDYDGEGRPIHCECFHRKYGQ
jgi:hypothetical protein